MIAGLLLLSLLVVASQVDAKWISEIPNAPSRGFSKLFAIPTWVSHIEGKMGDAHWIFEAIIADVQDNRLRRWCLQRYDHLYCRYYRCIYLVFPIPHLLGPSTLAASQPQSHWPIQCIDPAVSHLDILCFIHLFLDECWQNLGSIWRVPQLVWNCTLITHYAETKVIAVSCTMCARTTWNADPHWT